MTTSARDLRRLRLSAQRIEQRPAGGPADVVRWLLALQGQDLPGSKWSIGLRAPGSTLANVDAAFAAGEIIRSWPMRGTLHVVAAPDIGWMLSLTAERTLRSLATRHRGLDIDESVIGAAAQVAVDLLAGGRAATRTELFTALGNAGIATTGQRGPHLLGALHQTELLCLGPMQGNEQAVVLLDEWVTAPRRLEREEALGEFVRRFFLSHGPATIRDFAWWTKLPLRDANLGLAVARGELQELEVDGVGYWMAPDLPDAPSHSVRLLPGFDEFLLGYTDRAASLDAAYAQAIVPGGNGMFLPTVVVDGRVVGTWRRRKTGAGLMVTPELFEPLNRRELAAMAAAAGEYGDFQMAPVTLVAATG